MALIHDPSRLNQRIAFGHMLPGESTTTGAPTAQFISDMEVYCGRWTRTVNQAFEVVGTERQDDITVIIRHNPDVFSGRYAQFTSDDMATYKVIAINPDDSGDLVAYDLVTLRKVSA